MVRTQELGNRKTDLKKPSRIQHTEEERENMNQSDTKNRVR